MQVRPVALFSLLVGAVILIGCTLFIGSRGNVVFASRLQASTPTPLPDDLLALGDSNACTDLFSNFDSWLKADTSVRFFFVTNEPGVPIDDSSALNVASYATGELTYSDPAAKELKGQGTQVFNDRNQFDPAKADKVELTISPTKVQMSLLSWGNAVVNFSPPHCTNGTLIALGQGNPNRTGNYNVMVVFTFRKGRALAQ